MSKKKHLEKNNEESSEVREQRLKNVFDKLDINHTGKIDLPTLKRSFEQQNHPLRNSDFAMETLFRSMDVNNDSVVDFDEFRTFAQQAEQQIATGFKKIDKDNDGLIRRSEVSFYLSKIQDLSDLTEESQDRNYNRPNELKKGIPAQLNKFIEWAFKKRNSKESPTLYHHEEVNDQDHDIESFHDPDEDPDHYISYDQWRDFLLLMPREKGSRLRTVYSYFYLFKEDVDLSSEGDMTLINEFIRGFGYFLTGGISGVISRTCTAPFDRIKVFLIARTDLSSTILNSKQDLLAKNPKANLEKIRSPIVKAITSIYRQGGFRAFYVGNGLNTFKVFPESSIKFGTFELTKSIMAKLEGSSKKNLSQLSTYLAGGMAGVVAQFSSYPIDTLKFRIQCASLDNPINGNQLLINTARQMYKEGGLSIFYRGVTVGVIGIFPYAALDLGTFSALKKWYTLREAKKLNVSPDNLTLNNFVVLPMGAFSGSVGATVVYPINLLRTRLQAQGTFAHPFVYNGFMDVLRQTIQREGYQGLYKGLVPTLAKVCPAVSISYLCYENLKRLAKLE